LEARPRTTTRTSTSTICREGNGIRIFLILHWPSRILLMHP
jgi:hypothetical protein